MQLEKSCFKLIALYKAFKSNDNYSFKGLSRVIKSLKTQNNTLYQYII